MATAIEFDHVGKQYRLGLVSMGTLGNDLKRWWTTSILRKEDPFLKVGEVNDRSVKGISEYVWALKDIDFKVEQGDVVGIIGRNGAGKSTLLKLLSRVTGPTVGEIRAHGRIGSLLEVGTGFHPEMTGRENIYLNGTILGMTKPEIDRKLDEIIDFSGCERYIDTPVKRYSSGMMVRLGFAVAAHLEPEILIVDEVLAVGDAEFQKKAIGKMQDVSKGGGRTVLFVSHNMAAVKSLCKRGVVLDKGTVALDSDVDTAVEYYINQGAVLDAGKIVDNIKERRKFIFLDSISFNGTENSSSTVLSNQKYVDLIISGHTDEAFSANVKLIFKTMAGVPLMAIAESVYNGLFMNFPIGNFRIAKRIILPKYVNAGDCYLGLMLYRKSEIYFRSEHCADVHFNGNFDDMCMPLNIHLEGILGLEVVNL